MSRGKGPDGPHPVDLHVGRRVHEKRLSLGYNQSELGRALGLTFQQVQKYEKGANRISASKLFDIARFFKVDIGYFFEGLNAPSGQAGVAEQGTAFEHASRATRHSVEINRLSAELKPAQQRVVLDLLREMTRSNQG